VIRRISRELAAVRAAGERPPGSCLVCAILAGSAGPVHVLHQGRSVRAVLNRYPRGWGQAMVLLERHVTRFEHLREEEWAEASSAALALARRMELELRPLRVYVSSLGSPRGDLALSTPHLHVHVDPIFSQDDRPSTVFSSEAGLLEADPEDWEALRGRLAFG
jgi:diadenosine tetraphosphate (Ap4A) HIT family hydrolase